MDTRFEVGQTYWTRSIGDADCIIEKKILKRTAKTVTVNAGGPVGPLARSQTRFKSHVDSDGREYIFPWGRHSMCPALWADGKIDAKTGLLLKRIAGEFVPLHYPRRCGGTLRCEKTRCVFRHVGHNHTR